MRNRLLVIAWIGALAGCHAGVPSREFRAGAAAVDVSPVKLPAIVNGILLRREANQVVNPLYARALVLESDPVRVAIAVVDSCMMPRDLLDETKRLASRRRASRPTAC